MGRAQARLCHARRAVQFGLPGIERLYDQRRVRAVAGVAAVAPLKRARSRNSGYEPA
jgi:hypothetical protein